MRKNIARKFNSLDNGNNVGEVHIKHARKINSLDNRNNVGEVHIKHTRKINSLDNGNDVGEVQTKHARRESFISIRPYRHYFQNIEKRLHLKLFFKSP